MQYTYLVSYTLSGIIFKSEIIRSEIEPKRMTGFDIARALEKIYAIKAQNFTNIFYETKK